MEVTYLNSPLVDRSVLVERFQSGEFDAFDEHFIQSPDGYMPVYAQFEEDDDGECQKVVLLDMICEWRLHDGKVKFIEVPFETEEQFNAIIEYLKVAAKLLFDAISENIETLYFEATTK